VSARQVIVVGGGAAGFFAAVACAEASPGTRVTVLEGGPKFLAKVRISGGGRCNVTHACFDPRELATRYPRGGPALIGAFHRFQPSDTVEWFATRGVRLKTEPDGRMFPITDDSATIVDCLVGAARAAGVKLVLNCGVKTVSRGAGAASFQLGLATGETMACDRLLLATGGCRAEATGQLVTTLGHTLEPPVPSLFTLQVELPWLRSLAGLAVEAEVSVPGTTLRERGPLLATHWGVSGPAILRLSAWGARALHGFNYTFPLRVNWLPRLSPETLTAALARRRMNDGARLVVNVPLPPLPARLWEQLVLAAGLPRQTTWANLTRAGQQQLTQQLQHTELSVTGKSLNKDEFVTCGGVRLSEVNFATMESRLGPGLHFAGELLDVDGITGGFNFQAAWTTGWLAGQAMAAAA